MSKHPLNIFLPAAGLGERLRPVTNHLPKPLLPILGKPIIEGILEKLTAVCDGKIGINLHWKPEMLRSWAASSPWANRITFFPENPILGTGGALKNAGALLSGGPFIVHNADILLDADFTLLIKEHLASGNIATLACHKLPSLSNVVIDKSGQILDVENPGDSRPNHSNVADKVAYTGIAVYSPEILSFLPNGVSHATVAWIAASKAGYKVRAMDFTGAYWNDVGTPGTYVRGVLDALRNDGETVYRSLSAECGRIAIDGFIVLESGSNIRDNARLRNCIVMPDASVSGEHENRILGQDYAISLSESDMQPSLHAAEKKRVSLSEPLFARYFEVGTTDVQSATRNLKTEIWSEAILIGLGGSDRRYFRIRNDRKTAVLMECTATDPDYDRHLVYTEFFSHHAVPVPKLLAADHTHKSALFEDLGDASLYSFIKLPLGNSSREEIYRGVLSVLVKIHTTVTEHVDDCPLLKARIFDYDHLRWETDYFLERFVAGLKKIEPAYKQVIEEELHRLAQTVDAYPKSVIHRDFQCQNIMIRNGIPRLIDYQGARMAPVAYDIASILWDPYHRLDNGLREALLNYYIGEMKGHAKRFDERTFLDSLLPCRLQRHMQALGAYGFLSMVRGKSYFLKHVPEALRMLREEAAAVKSEYPGLDRLIQRIA